MLKKPCENAENPTCDNKFEMVCSQSLQKIGGYQACDKAVEKLSARIFLYSFLATRGRTTTISMEIDCGPGNVTYKVAFRPSDNGGCIIEGEAVRFVLRS